MSAPSAAVALAAGIFPAGMTSSLVVERRPAPGATMFIFTLRGERGLSGDKLL
jgi:hypothetical protein